MMKFESLGSRLAAAAALAVALALPSLADAAELYSGSNSDVRTILYYKASTAALSKYLPAGWELSPFTSAPSAGANLQVEFVDQLYAVDPKGTVGAPYRYVLFGIPVHKTGSSESVLMLFDGLSRGGAGPYGIAETSNDDVNRGVHYSSGPTTVNETWNFEGGGEKISLQTEFERGPVTLEKGDSHVYSQLKPEFSRIYRYNEAADVVKSGDANHLHSLSLKAEGGKLTAMFDGSESLVSVVSLPVYSRDIFVPQS
ncbi:hypothetical protein DBIPINDM_003025 [Mesorhizobium sp. AR02]|uniref:hypothetical protein n=1 Tax=Mesorhizobium sp. AR02 TaxID=2865837 RepID=UPI00215E080B|nr:hypothetical protein [Mesorhizobium sp. AR02]UVK56418.1 hypothetical protein DBIPINDM_003025 [Mesorhizobium sp. AR02]